MDQAELEANVKKLQADQERLTAELETEKKKNADAQTMIGKQATEIGELRKKVSAEPPTKGGTKTEEDDESTAEEVEKKLSDTQKAAVEDVYKSKLTDEERRRFHSEDGFKKAVLKMAMEEVVEVPESPWTTKKPAKAKPNDLEDKIRQLFRKEKTKTNVPPGPTRRPSTAELNTETEGASSRSTSVRSAGVLGTIELERKGS